MKSWSDRKARQEAKRAFWSKLNEPGNETLRQRCLKHPAFARAQFAQCGEFYLEEQGRSREHAELDPIPLDVEFRVFEEDVASREKMVVLVLRKDLTETNEPGDPEQIWQCTWWPYEQ